MEYNEKCKYYSQEKLPEVWKKAVEAEKLSELLVYDLIASCLENFSDMELVIGMNSNVAKVLSSWVRNPNNSFGKNAVRISTRNDYFVMECRYDIQELKEDLETLASDMFGTLDTDKVGESTLFSDQIGVSDMEFQAIQKTIKLKRISVPNEN